MSGLLVGMTFRRLPTNDHPLLLVALALAEQADSEGKNVFPSVDLLATETRLSRRSVQYQIADLHSLGFLILVKKGGGRKNPNLWAIDVDWLERQPDRVKAMRAEKELKNHTIKNSAPHALFSPVEKLAGLPVQNPAETCTNSAQTVQQRAPNPPTLVPCQKPPPVGELVDAAIWAADRSQKPPRNRGAYRATLVNRMTRKVDNDDLKTWRDWLHWQEEQHLLGVLRQ